MFIVNISENGIVPRRATHRSIILCQSYSSFEKEFNRVMHCHLFCLSYINGIDNLIIKSEIRCRTNKYSPFSVLVCVRKINSKLFYKLSNFLEFDCNIYIQFIEIHHMILDTQDTTATLFTMINPSLKTK